MITAKTFMADVEEEAQKARAKFPSSRACMTALMEEVGELAKAMLDEPRDRVYREAVQVATMAMRVATEGDPTLDEHRRRDGGPDA